MASVVSICNLALSNIGKENISDLGEASSEARACNQFYEHTRDALLQAYPWRFADRTRAMASIENTMLGTWGYAYNRPNDCLKARFVRPSYAEAAGCVYGVPDRVDRYPYDIEGDTIYCNIPTAFLKYTTRLADTTRFSPLFVEALSWHLAVRLAMPLTRDPKVRADAYQLAQATQGAAEVADANEVRETSDHASEYDEVRG